jgi:hypothetical protein
MSRQSERLKMISLSALVSVTHEQLRILPRTLSGDQRFPLSAQRFARWSF